MPFTFSEIIVLFFTYSVIGWIWETIYCSIKDHHYDYRGFLFGSYCPVYGFAVTTILIYTHRIQNNLFLLYIVGVIVVTIFEYFASVFLQYVFHMKLWDYSHLWDNVQGRIAPIISLFLGDRGSLSCKSYSAICSKVNYLGRNKNAGLSCFNNSNCDGNRLYSYYL